MSGENYRTVRLGPFEIDNRISAGHLASLALLGMAVITMFVTLENRLTTLEATRPSLKEDISELQKDMDWVRKDISEIKPDIAEIMAILDERDKK